MKAAALIRVILLLCLTSVPAHADLKIVTRRSFGGHPATTSEVKYLQGKRMRTEYGQAGNRYQRIYQCDLQKVIELNTDASLFDVTELGSDGFPVGHRTFTLPPGPVMEYTITTEDTGERATIFGYPAWHVRETVTQSSAVAGATRTVSDYWFVDLNVPFDCHAWPSGQWTFIGDNPRFKIKRIGEAKRGFPVLTRHAITINNTQTENVIEVIELSKEPLDPKLFEIPENFRPALKVNGRVHLDTPDTPGNRVKAYWKEFWQGLAGFLPSQ